ncbi:MAG: ArsR family transcriptional regulator [Methanobacteriota archaeon]|nr:MAG: ArsR family transcriptional regulator [Euryarchaeota archaeon]
MKKIQLKRTDQDKIIAITKAMSSPTRFKILQLLADDEYDISKLARALDQTEANISAQVKHLEKAKLVECRYEPGDHGVRKICKAVVPEIHIEIFTPE